MIGTIRKHSTWMWMVIIAAIIITFVYWGSAPNKFNRDDSGRANFGSINGERISREDLGNAQHEVYLRYFFNYGEWPDKDAKRTGFDVERETYFRLLLIQKEKQLGIHASAEAVARVAADILRSFNRGNPLPLDVFVKQILNRQGLTADDFERFVRHDLGIQQLVAAAGLSGKLVTPQEARLLYEREHEELSTDAVFFSGSNYLAGITVTPEAVAEFFTNRMANYRLPDRVQVSYVKFDATNFAAVATAEIAKVTNLTERIEAIYQQRGTNSFPDAKSPTEAKEKIREEIFHNETLFQARKQANEFARALFELEPMRVENLEKQAKEKGLTVQVSAPFSRDYGPEDFKVGADFVKEAFLRTADEPFAGPFVGKDGAYVIALHKKIPSEIPPLEKIRDQVALDCKYNLAVQAAVKAGETLATALTNGLAKGKTFSAICSEADVRAVSLPPLSLSTRALPQVEGHASLLEFKRAAFTTELGKSSGFIPSSDGGFVVFVRERLPLELAKITADLPAFLNSVRQQRQSEAFNDWFRKEAEKGLRDTPIARPQPPQMTGAPKK